SSTSSRLPSCFVQEDVVTHLSLSSMVTARTSGRIRREFGWPEVSQGLGLVLRGYAVLILGAIASSGLLWFWAWRSEELHTARKAVREANAYWLVAGLATLGVTVLVAGTVLVLGQCRCVGHAPDRHGAKPWVFVSVTALIVGLLLILTTSGLGVVENYDILLQGWQGAQALFLNLTAQILLLTTAGVLVLAVVFFTLFLRAVAACFRDERRILHLDGFLVFTAFLLGGSLFGLLGNK